MSRVSLLSPRVQQVARIIEESEAEGGQFLRLLPSFLGILPADYGWLKLAESSFEFWDNEEDAIYNEM